MALLEDFRPCVGGLSVVKAVARQLRELINSGLAQWRRTSLMETVAESGKEELSPVRKHQIQLVCGE